MSSLYTRRDVLKAATCAFSFSFTSAYLGGCSKNVSIEPKIVSIQYNDSDAFFDEFLSELDKGSTVKVKFDKGERLTKDSKLFQLMKDENRVLDRTELFKSLQEMDTTDEGRKELAQILDPNLLNHDQIHASTELPSGEICEPGTILLIAVILLVAGVVTNEIASGRRIKRVSLGPCEIEFEPVSS